MSILPKPELANFRNNNFVISCITFIFSLAQLISPRFLNFNGFTTITPLIIPANYTFIIWGPITLGCVAFAGYQLFSKHHIKEKFSKINFASIGLFSCFVLWLYLAGQNLQWATVVVFVAMFGLLLYINNALVKTALTRVEKIVVQAPFLLYLGWSSVAIFANVTSALVAQGSLFEDERSLLSYIFILLAVLGNVVWVGKLVKFNWYFVGTVIWAFVGILVGAYSRDSGIIPWLCEIAIIVLLASKWYTLRSTKLTR
jgi:hypothetical protein